MSAELFRLDGKIAIVTGGSRGLGLYMAEGIILAGGAKVYISSRNAEACEKAVNYLNDLAKEKGLSGRALSIPADLSTREGAEHLFNEFSKVESKLDILVANAGVLHYESLETHPDSAMGQVLDVNVRGVFSTIQLFVPFLEKAGNHQDPSRILITGSIIALRIGNFGIGTYGYLASKAAVHHLGEGLAVELGPRNITVNVLSPSVFPSEMSNGLLGDSTSKFADANPRRRLGEKQDIVAATVYLLSPGGSYINGAVLPIDGGAHLT